MSVIITTKTWATTTAEEAETVIRQSEASLDVVLAENCMCTLYVHDAESLELIRSVCYDSSESWEWADYAEHIRDLLDGGDGLDKIEY